MYPVTNTVSMLSKYYTYDDCYSNCKFATPNPDFPSPIGCCIGIKEAKDNKKKTIKIWFCFIKDV